MSCPYIPKLEVGLVHEAETESGLNFDFWHNLS